MAKRNKPDALTRARNRAIERAIAADLPKLASKHPTCEALLPLLEQALSLVREKVDPQSYNLLLGAAYAHSRQVLASKGGPFGRIEVQTLVQEAFLAGYKYLRQVYV